jgi:hypothetical protein
MSLTVIAVILVVVYLLWRFVFRFVFTAVRVIRKTSKTMSVARAEAARLSTLPMQEFLHEWMRLATQTTGGAAPRLRAPATEEQITSVEQKLGEPLPPELRAFYATTDGIDLSAVKYRKNIIPLSALKLSSMYSPPLSTQTRSDWEKYGKAENEPEGLPVTSTDLVKILTNNYEVVIPFNDVDSMLSLEVPEFGKGTVIVHRPHYFYPVGTVLEIENFCATRHNGVKSWLASHETVMAKISYIGSAK